MRLGTRIIFYAWAASIFWLMLVLAFGCAPTKREPRHYHQLPRMEIDRLLESEVKAPEAKLYLLEAPDAE